MGFLQAGMPIACALLSLKSKGAQNLLLYHTRIKPPEIFDIVHLGRVDLTVIQSENCLLIVFNSVVGIFRHYDDQVDFSPIKLSEGFILVIGSPRIGKKRS